MGQLKIDNINKDLDIDTGSTDIYLDHEIQYPLVNEVMIL